MKIVVFGLARRGHHVTSSKRDVPCHAANRDLHDPPGGALVVYPDRAAVAEAAMVTSDGSEAALGLLGQGQPRVRPAAPFAHQGDALPILAATLRGPR